ncbi:MAG TPA: NAD(P)/FAD-dependent oxidoreductase [Burkholderiales bacterium]|nr:NAD(P)/FAD-dependent oxidoreductase [Burkholderiales bacterium]
MTERVDCVVVGAGVVGLAVARELALEGREVIVLEAEASIGNHTSSRNSEVIHAGIYYPTGSLKAQLCVAGKTLLYEYCREHGVPHANCGKVLVAAHEDEIGTVLGYIDKAKANGVHDLRRISLEELHELEPAVRAAAAVYSPSTGIIDSHAYMLALQGDLEQAGGAVVFLSPVQGGEVTGEGIVLEVGGSEAMRIVCNTLINSAGLTAAQLARSIRGIPAATIPPQYFAKGHYYTMSGKSPFRHLVYPMAGAGYLGVHVTIDLGGQARFGPDIAWIDRIDYSFDDSREPLFYEAIRQYYPELKDGALQPGYTGIRPKISGPKEPAADFSIQGPRDHGVRGLVNLYGIESPGLTASLAIARRVRELLR